MRFVALVALLAVALAACDATFSDATPAQDQTPLNSWTPQLAIVFPVHAANSKDTYAVNVSVWPANRVLCGKLPNPPVSLYIAKDFDPVAAVSQQPTVMHRSAGSVSFPSEEFDGVPANMVADPNASFSLVAFLRGQPASNVWLYGKAPAQYTPVKPTGYGSPDPAALDTRIQVVFPHDDQGKQTTPAKATQLNIAVDVFQHGTTLSVPPDAKYMPQLWEAEGSSPAKALPPGVQKTTYSVGGQGYPRWVFNDVRVDPGKTYHFMATIGQLGQHGGAYPTVWTHGTASKAAPKIEVPPSCIP